MDIFSVFTMLGGLAFFLYGMNVMSTSLEKLTGGKLETALNKMTSNKFKSILLGMGVTIAIQSSSALTVMLVGFVNSGLMELEQTISVCFGSNIGTTFTAWMLSFDGLNSDSIFMKMLKPESFSPIVALVGIMMIMISKSNKKKDIGRILVGFAVLMTGMSFMSQSVDPLAESPEFREKLTAFNNPVLGVLVGTGFTGIIQSSAATVGILMAFSRTNGLTYEMALPIIMGANIGTCVTALLSTIGVSKDAKRVAWIHISVKIIGTLILLPLVIIAQSIFHFEIMESTVHHVGIAVMHTIFNILTTFLFLPFTKQLVRLSHILVRDSKEEPQKQEESVLVLDERFLKTPSVAIQICRGATVDMALLTETTINDALELLRDYDAKLDEKVRKGEDDIDCYEDKLNSYLVRLSKSSITAADSRTVSKMMHVIGNLERISDHAVNLAESAQEMHEKNISFSEECVKELNVISKAISENISKAFEAYIADDLSVAHTIEPLEEVVDNLSAELKNRHIDRLKKGICTVELGYIYQDILTNLERISDHCSNIAGCIIEIEEKTNIHAYLHNLKENDEEFRREYNVYSQNYFSQLDNQISAEPAKSMD